MTGYGFALPKKSKYLAKFNEKMIEYRENGAYLWEVTKWTLPQTDWTFSLLLILIFFLLAFPCPCPSIPFYLVAAGDLERLRKFWFQGACKPSKNKGMLSKPLDVNQFMSAFLLLGCGILLTIVLLALEHFYFRYCRGTLSKTDKDGCFTLVSLVRRHQLN